MIQRYYYRFQIHAVFAEKETQVYLQMFLLAKIWQGKQFLISDFFFI